VRRFTAEYLDATREGMWADSRSALADLNLDSSERVLDVGAGTGELTAVLREETDGEVIAVDADPGLLAHAGPPRVAGDATRLPVRGDSVDLVVCQALLVNLPDPVAALSEFARVARERVAVIEPDNAAVTVDSTVGAESDLAERARRLYVDAAETDPAVGDASELFAAAGMEGATVRRYDHERTTAPPYSEQALEAARRKASGAGIDSDRETILGGETTAEEFDALRERWRAMGRDAIEQIRDGEYERTETVPFYVTVGRVGESGDKTN
jgi:SAM-dependent methyltransferase